MSFDTLCKVVKFRKSIQDVMRHPNASDAWVAEQLEMIADDLMILVQNLRMGA
jgi:hypothetical protein